MAKRSLTNRLPEPNSLLGLSDPELPIAKRKLDARGKLRAGFGLFFARIGDVQIDQAAAALAYYAILSLFPTALMIINILPHLGIRFTGLHNVLNQVIPANVLATISPTLHKLAAHPSNTWLGIGAVVTLWAASLGVASLKSAYNAAYDIRNNSQNYLLARIVSMLMMVILVVAVIGIMVAFAFGQQFLEWLTHQFEMPTHWLHVFLTWRWPVTVTVIVVALVVIDYFLPNARMKFWTVLPGILFTLAGWLILAQAFSLYMRYFGKTFDTYGTLGAFIVLLLWLFFSSVIMIIGAVMNAVCHEYYYGRPEETNGKFFDLLRMMIHRLRNLIDED
ncbi:YihY/virulence factor BrkB family protein [Lacticaseibacillus pabuli]|uniref:YihY/virulence factor BrkB family protein n=1 Tax=Lacticaseibacillus pabuli TaxID=3025672 RepID=A0ABY7WWP6_9LACO|nr:YihY/virulence factor BrkB family protein [Lacticaseibacillus sp. KACC 23028]WDF83484.1 YihY/virulence factor BrkB family protein [Lacticaseibacillus sp. KACC 23028]